MLYFVVTCAGQFIHILQDYSNGTETVSEATQYGQHSMCYKSSHPWLVAIFANGPINYRRVWETRWMAITMPTYPTWPDTDSMTLWHYNDIIMTTIASQITSLTVAYSTLYSDADQRKHQSSASLAFVWGIHRDQWIPRTKGQLRGKCFHLMTSSRDVSEYRMPSYLW